MAGVRLTGAASILITADLPRTAAWYRDMLGFRVVENSGGEEKFAALYRDAVEIILVQSRHGAVRSNRKQYGVGYDAYLVPENPAAVEAMHADLLARGADILQPPAVTSYGSLEFVLRDIDDRLIGVGCIRDGPAFFGPARRRPGKASGRIRRTRARK
jgi:catechol 2,3-dioxygenase-like lactoylglutathione lyase family enzyme